MHLLSSSSAFMPHMREHNVDIIGGDFNMSAFSTVSDVFSDPEFSAPGHSCLWGLGALDEQHRECTGFLSMPKRPYEWTLDAHGCYKYDNAELGCGPRDQTAHLPVFLHLRRIVNALGFSSCQSVLTSGVSIHMVATNLTMQLLGLGTSRPICSSSSVPSSS